MRIRRAALVALSLAALVPSAGAAQTPPAVPEIRVQGADDPLRQTSFGTVSFTVDRDTYAALFELARDGRVRVLHPSRPSDTARVQADRRQWARAWSPDMPTLSTMSYLGALADPVPFVFVVTSDRPLDLSAFGRGKRWSRQLMAPDPSARPEAVIASIVDDVVAEGASHDWDFAYLAPRLTARQQIALIRCTSPAAFWPNDFWAYHSLWGLATSGAFRHPRAGLPFTTYFSPAFGAPAYWFGPAGSCVDAPLPPTYVAAPRMIERVAQAPVPSRPTPLPPDTAYTPVPGSPNDSAAPPRRAPQRPLDVNPSVPRDDAPIRTGDWRERASAFERLQPRGAARGAGSSRPIDPLPTAVERVASWKAERLAEQPPNADEAAARLDAELERLVRRLGLTRAEASAIARGAGAAGSGRSSGAASDPVRRAEPGHRGTHVAESRSTGAASGGAPRSPATGDAPRAEPVARAPGSSASSAAPANAPGRAAGEQQRKAQ